MARKEILTGMVIDERMKLTTVELCRACGSSTEWVVELVREGVLKVEAEGVSAGENADAWRFSGATLERAIRARRLQRDLELNLPGLALALELMDEIQRLRRRL